MQYSQQGLTLHPVTEHTGISAMQGTNIHTDWDMSSATEPMKRLLIFKAGGLLALHLENCDPVTLISLSPLETPLFSLKLPL